MWNKEAEGKKIILRNESEDMDGRNGRWLLLHCTSAANGHPAEELQMFKIRGKNITWYMFSSVFSYEDFQAELLFSNYDQTPYFA